MQLQDKIKSTDTFFSADFTPFVFPGGRNRFRNSTYADVLKHGAYLYIAPEYDPETQELDGQLVYSETSVTEGVVNKTVVSQRIDKAQQLRLAAISRLSAQDSNTKELRMYEEILKLLESSGKWNRNNLSTESKSMWVGRLTSRDEINQVNMAMADGKLEQADLDEIRGQLPTITAFLNWLGEKFG
jgi:hypothetical protein